MKQLIEYLVHEKWSHHNLTIIHWTFEKHLRSVSRAVSQRFGILRKSWQVFQDRSLLGRCLRLFVLPVWEYCSAVWCSAGDTHLRLLDRIVSGATFLTGGIALWQYYVCCTRSGVTRCTLFVVLFLCRICRWGFTRRCDRTSVHLCASSLQNLAVSRDFYSLVSISVERS